MQNVPDYDVEMSEILLYHVHVLEDLGEYTEALASLVSVIHIYNCFLGPFYIL